MCPKPRTLWNNPIVMLSIMLTICSLFFNFLYIILQLFSEKVEMEHDMPVQIFEHLVLDIKLPKIVVHLQMIIKNQMTKLYSRMQTCQDNQEYDVAYLLGPKNALEKKLYLHQKKVNQK